MKATIKKTLKSPAKKASAASGKRSDRRVPLDEMRRLMAVYGPLKCLRKRVGQSTPARGTPAAAVPLKVDSVKRKFYRWFPDLDERFVKDGAGFYKPKFGHEGEIRYREAMRAKDGESLAKKRATCRRRSQAAKTKGKAGKNVDNKPLARTVSADGGEMPPLPPMIRLEVDHDPAACSKALEEEPVDRTFVAEENIFDDVEKTFYTPPASPVGCPSVEWSSASSGEEQQDADSDASFHDMKNVLDETIEECCGEMGADAGVEGLLFDMISA